MDGALLVAVVVVVGIAALVPLFLPWPQRVRWAVAAQATVHAGIGPAPCAGLDLREVVLVSVQTSGTSLTLGVVEVGRPAGAISTCGGTPVPTNEVVSMLREWCSLRTPMLLHIAPTGDASLHGPAAAVPDLRQVGARAALDAP